MPYTIRIDSGRRIASIGGSGENDLASTLAAMDRLAGDSQFEAGFGILCDFRDNAYTPATDEARALTEAYTARFAGRPMALVVSSLLHYGVANMITTIMRLRNEPVAAFRDLEEAETWLADAVRGLHSTG